MITIRVHLDPVDTTNAPLKILLGSHKLGKVAEQAISSLVAKGMTMECHAGRGDVWLYSTPIIHASVPTTSSRRRRVLQIDMSCEALPTALEWQGLD